MQPETEQFFQDLREMKQGLLEAWSLGDFVSHDLNLRAIGQCQMLDQILSIKDDRSQDE